MNAPLTLPPVSRAVVMSGARSVTDPDCFIDRDMPLPDVGSRDLVVRVRALSVNPVDVKVRRRAPPSQPPQVLGWDAAGVVVATGSDCALFHEGDHVYYAGDINRPGSNSEYQVVDERLVGRMPANLDFARAAALPLTALTAWEVLFERLDVRRPDTGGNGHLLVIAGAGGVGSMAIQMARHAGLRVIATASRPQSEAWVRAQGAHAVVDHSRGLVQEWRRLGLPLPEYILCCAETDEYFDAMAELVAPQGRIGVLAGTKRPHDIQPLMQKSAALVWENIFAKSDWQTPDMASQHRILDQVAHLVERGELRTTLTKVLGPLTAGNLREAHARI